MASTSFWTPERIARAVPIHTPWQQRSDQVNASITEVITDEDRVGPFHRCIGLLMGSFGQGEKEILSWGTAYATNASDQDNVIFTAAHNLVRFEGQYENIVFMPAVLSDGQCPYGKFEQIKGKLGTAFFIHPKFVITATTCSLEYDLGAVKLQTNENGESLRVALGGAWGGKLLSIAVNKQYDKRLTAFRAFGYYNKTVMEENIGNFTRSEGGMVYKSGELQIGCSGGPWFLNEDWSVNGSLSGGIGGEDISPYYSGEKIKAIVDQLKAKNSSRQSKSWLCCFK